MTNEGKVLTRKFLLNLIWGKIIYVQEQSVDFGISGMKKKLGDYSEFIETINGTGYRFTGNNIR